MKWLVRVDIKVKRTVGLKKSMARCATLAVCANSERRTSNNSISQFVDETHLLEMGIFLVT